MKIQVNSYSKYWKVSTVSWLPFVIKKPDCWEIVIGYYTITVNFRTYKLPIPIKTIPKKWNTSLGKWETSWIIFRIIKLTKYAIAKGYPETRHIVDKTYRISLHTGS